MEKKELIGSFFKFLENKEDREIRLQAQFTFTPDDINWEGLAYNLTDLNLIKDTDNMSNIVWDKLDQSSFDVLNWVIQNSPDNVDMTKIDINQSGIIGLLAKKDIDIPWGKVIIDDYVDAMNAYRYGKEFIDWDNQIDYTSATALKFFAFKDPDILDVNKIDASIPGMDKIIEKLKK